MIDREAILLACYSNEEVMRKLMSHGLKDENVEILGEDALKVWRFAKGWFQRNSKSVPEKFLLEEFEQYVKTTRENGEEDVENVDIKWLVGSLQRDYLYENFKGRIAEAQDDGTFSRELDFEDAQKRSRQVAADLLRITANADSDDPLMSVTELLPNYLDDVLRYHEKIESGELAEPVTFGFKRVDDQYLGMAPGEMMVLMAYTGMGKSFVMCKFALAAVLQGKRVALWTLENSRDETLTRISALAGKLAYDHITNKVLAPPERAKLTALLDQEHLSRLFVKEPITHEGATLEEIYWESSNMDVDLIVGDQLSHVYYAGEKRGDPDWLNETNKLRYARNLGREVGVASMWAGQANVKAHGKAKVDLTMMARSQGYNQGSDFIFALSDPSKGTSTTRRLECIKARRGPKAAWQLAFNYAPMDIEAVGPASDPD